MPRPALALALGVATLAAVTAPSPAAAEGRALSLLKQAYAPPLGVPFPDDNPYSPAKQELGRRLFHEPALSGDGSIACATCHDPGRGFTDGLRLGHGVPGQELPRHTPALWNLAWAPALFWDGHADSLEHQARGPIENPIEMAQPLAQAVAKLAADPAWRQSFAGAFPEAPTVDESNLLAALATYERTLVSPPTRFDRWVGGRAGGADARPRSADSLLFNGKGGCAAATRASRSPTTASTTSACPAPTPAAAPRSAFRRRPRLQDAGLRELAWTAPYMHDGSLRDAGRRGRPLRERRRRPADRCSRTCGDPDAHGQERSRPLAFLETLSAETPPPALARAVGHRRRPPEPCHRRHDLVQPGNKLFAPHYVRVGRGSR